MDPVKYTADAERTLVLAIPHTVVSHVVCPVVAQRLPPAAIVLRCADDVCEYVSYATARSDSDLNDTISLVANLTALHASDITLSEGVVSDITSLRRLKQLFVHRCIFPNVGVSTPAPLNKLGELRDLESLRLEGAPFCLESPHATVADALAFIRRCRRLSSVTVSGGLKVNGLHCTATAVQNIVACKTLRRVELGFAYVPGEDIAAFSSLPLLEHLSLRHSDVPATSLRYFDTLPPSLESLELFRCDIDFSTSEAAEHLSRVVERLTTFALVQRSAPGAAIATITASASKLTSLSLSECCAASSEELQQATAHLKRLRSLDVSATRCDSPAVKALQSLPNLDTLSVAYCRCLDDQAIELLSGIPTLTHLNLFQHYIEEAEELKPLERLKSLSWLRIGDCEDLSYSDLARVSPTIFALLR